jgi:hypothetical protein
MSIGYSRAFSDRGGEREGARVRKAPNLLGRSRVKASRLLDNEGEGQNMLFPCFCFIF